MGLFTPPKRGIPPRPDRASPLAVLHDGARREHRARLVALRRAGAEPRHVRQMVEMGMNEGLRSARGQLDAVLAEPAPIAATRAG